MTATKLTDALKTGELEPVATVAQRFYGRRPSRPTQWRWINKGIQGVKLAVVAADVWRTTNAAFEEFLNKRTEAKMREKERLPDATDDDLKAAGLL